MEEEEEILADIPCDVPFFVWESIAMHVTPIHNLGAMARSCKFFRQLVYNHYFMVSYWRVNECVWDVLRYKRAEESWAFFCQRTMLEKALMVAKRDDLTERIRALEGLPQQAQRDNLCAYTYSQRGLVCLTNLRDFHAALKDFEEAGRLYSEEVMPSALNNMAVAYLYLGNLHRDISYFVKAEQKLLEGNQTTQASVSGGNLCAALIKQGRFEDALRIAHTATKLARREPYRNANAFHHKAFVLYCMSMHERAVSTASKAIKWNPLYSEAYFTRGLALLALGKKEEADADFAKALSISRSTTCWTYCHMYANSGEPTCEGFAPRMKLSESLDWLSESDDVPSPTASSTSSESESENEEEGEDEQDEDGPQRMSDGEDSGHDDMDVY